MSSPNTVSTGIGLRHVRAAVRDDDGTFLVPATVPTGTAYAGVQALKSRALTVTPAEPQRITARGDDANYHTFQEAPTENPTGELRTQTSDISLIALLTSVKDFGSPNQRMVAISSDKVGKEDPIIIWGTRKAVDTEPGSASYGQRVWETYIILDAYVSARPPTMEDSQIGEFVWSMSVNNSAVDHLGRPFTEALHGCTEAPYLMLHTRYQFFLDAFVGNGEEKEFTLTKGASVKHDTSTSPLIAAVNGVVTPVTVSEAGVVTFAEAPADGAKIMVQYEWDD
jgi:hypothetical protein